MSDATLEAVAQREHPANQCKDCEVGEPHWCQRGTHGKPRWDVGEVIYSGRYWKYALDHAWDFLAVVDSPAARCAGYPQRVSIRKDGQIWAVRAA